MSSKKTIKKIILTPSRLVHKDLIPINSSERVVSWYDLIWLWLGMAAQMGVFLLGASFVGGLTFFDAIAAIIIGNLGAAVVLILIGDIGIEHGINFSVFVRAPFGYLGSYLPMIVRAIAAICWFGIQTFYGAAAIDFVIQYFTGFSNIPMWFFLFAILQIWITAKGIKSIKWAENIAAPALLILCLWAIYFFISKITFAGVLSFPITKEIAFWTAVTANLSYWSTVALNIPDFTKYVKVRKDKNFLGRNFHSITGQIVTVPLGMVIFATVGMVGAMATGYGNPVMAIYATMPSAIFLIIALVIILFAQLSTNIAANLVAPGYIFNNIGAPRISYANGVVIGGILGMLTFPWILIEFFLTYLPTLGAFLSPVAGIMLADYYLIRKRRLSVRDLYKKGEFNYFKGCNPAAYLAYFISAIIGLVVFKYSWLFSMPVSIISYYLLMKYWILSKYPQIETKENLSRDYLATSVGRDWPVELENTKSKQKGK